MEISTPHDLKRSLPPSLASSTLVASSREAITDIIKKQTSRKIVIVGPCSIHRYEDALRYADWASDIRYKFKSKLEIVMRVYFEKPRSTVGWKGLIYDPWIDGSHDIESGLKIARRVALGVLNRGVPIAHELLDVITPTYMMDLISWGAIGARTTESQIHRQLASSCPYPVGFKNSTSGDVQVAVDAACNSGARHSFLSIDDSGSVAIKDTSGNEASHVILRGSQYGPNFSKADIYETSERLQRAGLNRGIIVDLSHGNSSKDPSKQSSVLTEMIKQHSVQTDLISGIMIESNILGGRQNEADLWSLKRGISITDGCIDLSQTERLINEFAEAI